MTQTTLPALDSATQADLDLLFATCQPGDQNPTDIVDREINADCPHTMLEKLPFHASVVHYCTRDDAHADQHVAEGRDTVQAVWPR